MRLRKPVSACSTWKMTRSFDKLSVGNIAIRTSFWLRHSLMILVLRDLPSKFRKGRTPSCQEKNGCDEAFKKQSDSGAPRVSPRTQNATRRAWMTTPVNRENDAERVLSVFLATKTGMTS